jgi:disulfide bond formation protein DsbB
LVRRPGGGGLSTVTTETAQFFFSALSLIAAAATIGLVVLRLAAGRSAAAANVLAEVHGAALWLAFIVAAVSTLGSLYFSEVADFVPCTLCWYQRIAMYPLTVILLVAAIRQDRGVRWYAAPVALIGAAISGYHYLIEWRPELDAGTCDLFGPSCTSVWFREFGFVSLAFMALVGFITVLALLFLPGPARLEDDPGGVDDVPRNETNDRPAAVAAAQEQP